MAQSYIAMGGNVGDVVATMRAAMDRLTRDRQTQVTAVSRVFGTAPMGTDAGEPFLNAAAELETKIQPHELLDRLQEIERELGRTSDGRWTARPIDLDLLLYESAVIDEPRLTVPHPHLWYRRFVLDPLFEIAGDVVHPVFDETIAALRAKLLNRPLGIAVTGGCAEDRLAIGSLLRRAGVIVTTTESREDGPLSLAFLNDDAPDDLPPRVIDLTTLPGSAVASTQSVLTAIFDEPREVAQLLGT